ncbi:hypothetical protein SAMN05216302_100664 [Nitrosomonas aestuarii]|uniref:Major Facilitator Superfamily protein n=2 Tax=Nitrosomonas aestuarii TaxID=52441 RepID=A0A1I3ZFD6_9PROT|nr:hypothetical protein SAMN05216302_100664 [Nitrosomonas aestuarii]
MQIICITVIIVILNLTLTLLILMSQHEVSAISPIVLALPIAITGATQSLLVIALPIIIALTELKISQLSPVLGLSALAFLIGGYVWPRRIMPGQRRQLLQRLLAVAVISQILFVVLLFAGIYEVFGAFILLSALFVTRFIYGFTVSGVYPTVQAWLVSEHSESEQIRHRALTYMSVTINAARVLVPLIATGLIMYQSEMVLALLIGLPLAALLLLPREQIPLINVSLAAPVNRWPEITIVLPAVLVHMSLGIAEFIIGPYLSVEWGITLGNTLIYTALLLASIAACMMLTQFISLRYRLQPGQLLIWSPAGMALGAFIAAIYPSTLPAGLMLIAISLALLLPASATGAVAGRDPKAQAHASADLYTARILGHLLGVTIAGPLFEIASHLPLLAAAISALIAIPASAKLRRALTTGA